MRFIASLALAVLLAAPVTAGLEVDLDLTGTWFGEFKCTEYDSEGKAKFVEESELLISQSDELLAIDWDSGSYAGLAVSDAKKPTQRGTLSFIECDTDLDQANDFAEMSLLDAKIDREKGKGTIKGESNYNVDGAFIGECKWKFTLVSLDDPFADGCVAPVE